MGRAHCDRAHIQSANDGASLRLIIVGLHGRDVDLDSATAKIIAGLFNSRDAYHVCRPDISVSLVRPRSATQELARHRRRQLVRARFNPGCDLVGRSYDLRKSETLIWKPGTHE